MENGVCVYIGYYGPREIKYSGSGGAGNGNWGFAPCSYPQACTGEYDIYVVACPPNVPTYGLSLDPSGTPPPPAKSQEWNADVTNKCAAGQWTGIVFRGTH